MMLFNTKIRESKQKLTTIFFTSQVPASVIQRLDNANHINHYPVDKR